MKNILQKAAYTDYLIMLVRVKASNRGATPTEIQSNVEQLKSQRDNVIRQITNQPLLTL